MGAVVAAAVAARAGAAGAGACGEAAVAAKGGGDGDGGGAAGVAVEAGAGGRGAHQKPFLHRLFCFRVAAVFRLRARHTVCQHVHAGAGCRGTRARGLLCP